MSILPKNEPHQPHNTPKNFFIWGATMSGKSYLASYFPDSIVFSTDGNEKNSGTRPTIALQNKVNAQGKITESVIDILDKYILALRTEQHSFKTVVIDVIEDVTVLIEQAICMENNVKSLSDIPYGKGYSMFNSMLQELVIDLKALKMNVVYISREVTKTDSNDNPVPAPALKEKYYNVVNGNCDLVIRTQHLGSRYVQTVTDIRRKYKESEIEDPIILKILSVIPGALVKDKQSKTPTARPTQTNNKDGK
ncbi:AAA family ATPase [Companilactobacillus versmoldensis]|uniref:Phage NTP-binding protein n=1 Tax=Companilactobacillus versmoldensis DSM 14857 = KCTC 3814 TaxID=1423815 RepID=A0A0R1SP97_9LACO|nr:AAA family ATPase [Companilactobacillus versmoldensis]KRL68115.1 phage NTP-binding protein [Companilactobacillus versmoldensis DSM 14857 = KCTC 3814]